MPTNSSYTIPQSEAALAEAKSVIFARDRDIIDKDREYLSGLIDYAIKDGLTSFWIGENYKPHWLVIEELKAKGYKINGGSDAHARTLHVSFK